MTSFEALYEDELTQVQEDPRFLRLCTLQMTEVSKMSARHASQRVRLALQIQREQHQGD